MSDEIERIRHVYATQYNPDPEDRNYIWHPLNPVAIYYRQAQEGALAELLRRYDLPFSKLQVLDVGCGNGGLLRYLASLGVPATQLHGIDLMDGRIAAAKQLCPPGVTLQVGNAETLPYPEQSFDLVAQFTVFSSILDAALRQRIAAEMVRVLKAGGHVLWYDMYGARSANLHNLPAPEVRQLFPGLTVRHLQALHPPYAARMVRISHILCEVWERLPGLPKTHYLALLQKP